MNLSVLLSAGVRIYNHRSKNGGGEKQRNPCDAGTFRAFNHRGLYGSRRRAELPERNGGSSN